jgi:hypothetical protein
VLFAVEIEGVKLPGSTGGEVSVITKAEEGQHFVSIDGKRTYINLFGSSTGQGGVTPTRIQQGGHVLPPQKSASTIGTGYVLQPQSYLGALGSTFKGWCGDLSCRGFSVPSNAFESLVQNKERRIV